MQIKSQQSYFKNRQQTELGAKAIVGHPVISVPDTQSNLHLYLAFIFPSVDTEASCHSTQYYLLDSKAPITLLLELLVSPPYGITSPFAIFLTL